MKKNESEKDDAQVITPEKTVTEALATDDHAGQGGAFTFDGLTRKRTPNPEEKE